MKDLKVIFMGTPQFSVPVLEGLIESCNVIGVVTQPDKLVGRKKEIEFSPVKELAIKNNIKVLQPVKIREEFKPVLELNPDIIITCAYGQIIPVELLEGPKYKAINVHASLLPKYRGGAPIHWSLINGDEKTGITIMYMAEGMDDGDIISQEEVIIDFDDNLNSLEDKLSNLGKALLLKTLPSIISGDVKRIKQNDSDVTFAKIIKRSDEFIDFKDNAINIYNKVRALSPYPGGSVYLDGKILKIFKLYITKNMSSDAGKILDISKDGIAVGTKDFVVVIEEVQFEGKKKMLVKELLNGINKEKLINKYLEKEK